MRQEVDAVADGVVVEDELLQRVAAEQTRDRREAIAREVEVLQPRAACAAEAAWGAGRVGGTRGRAARCRVGGRDTAGDRSGRRARISASAIAFRGAVRTRSAVKLSMPAREVRRFAPRCSSRSVSARTAASPAPSVRSW